MNARVFNGHGEGDVAGGIASAEHAVAAGVLPMAVCYPSLWASLSGIGEAGSLLGLSLATALAFRHR